MNDRIKKALRHALWGLFVTMWNAGWNGACAVAGIDSIALSGLSETVQVLSGPAMLSAFVGSAIIHGIIWIKSHPLPDTLETEAPFPAPKP